jgi:alkylated DNA repair dioxygenase AlkB
VDGKRGHFARGPLIAVWPGRPPPRAPRGRPPAGTCKIRNVTRIDAGQNPLDLGGLLCFHPNWLSRADADWLFRELRSGVAWSQGTIQWFGREVPEPRLTAWFGDADYTYSGRTLRAAPWPAPIARLREPIEEAAYGCAAAAPFGHAAGAPLNAVLLNLYRDGRDSMGMHSDDEPELGTNPVVASLSLGEVRRFVLEPKKKSARSTGCYEVALGHGALLVMGGACQHHYRHGVPKDERCRGERINLTFRRVIGCSEPPR